MQEGIGDAVFNDHAIRQFAPWTAVNFDCAKFLFSHFVAPVTESALGEFHDVAFMGDGHRAPVVIYGILYGFTHQAFAAVYGHRFDAYGRGIREANFFTHAHVADKLYDFSCFVCTRCPFYAGINVFGVFTENNHVGFFWVLNWAGYAGKILHRAQADV